MIVCMSLTAKLARLSALCRNYAQRCLYTYTTLVVPRLLLNQHQAALLRLKAKQSFGNNSCLMFACAQNQLLAVDIKISKIFFGINNVIPNVRGALVGVTWHIPPPFGHNLPYTSRPRAAALGKSSAKAVIMAKESVVLLPKI